MYVLRTFNCEDRFAELFDLALRGNYEVQNHALAILQNQSFDVTAEQLGRAERDLEGFPEQENLSGEDFELLREELRSVLSRLGETTGGTD